jgi:hypothetical protein
MLQFDISLEHIFAKVPLFQGNAERQVLVRDYEVGKSVAFDSRIQNMKEVYTADGFKM